MPKPTKRTSPVYSYDEINGQIKIHLLEEVLDNHKNLMVSNWVWSSSNEHFVEIIFGQKSISIDHPTLFGALIISMPLVSIRELLFDPKTKEKTSFLNDTEAFIQKKMINIPNLLIPNPTTLPKDRIVFESANIMAISYAGQEAQIQFFRILPRHIHQIKNNNFQTKLPQQITQPVVTVILPLNKFFALINQWANFPEGVSE